MDVPERDLFFAVADLHGLYAVLVAALLVTAAGGYALSRLLFGPLGRLTRQAQVLAGGDLTRRAEIGGGDEIAALSARIAVASEEGVCTTFTLLRPIASAASAPGLPA